MLRRALRTTLVIFMLTGFSIAVPAMATEQPSTDQKAHTGIDPMG